MSFLARQFGAGREVSTILFLELVAHWTNRSREKPHSRSGTLANTACRKKGEGRGGEERRGVISLTLYPPVTISTFHKPIKIYMGS